MRCVLSGPGAGAADRKAKVETTENHSLSQSLAREMEGGRYG